MIPARPHMVDEVQYLIEAEGDKGKALITPQITTCKDKEFAVYIANPFQQNIETVLTITATPIVTILDKPATEVTSKNFLPYPLTASQKRELDELLEEFSEVLADKTDPLGTTDRITHTIDTGDERPIRQQPYRLSPSQKEKLEEEIEDMLHKKIIQPSKSPWSSPVVIVPKPDGGTRVCIDYRKLNSITKKDAHPLPKTEELLDHLHGAVIFSTIDLLSGFYQIPMDKKDIEKTAFTTHRGLF